MAFTREHARGAVAGVVAAGAGIALSELLSGWAHLRVSPVEAVAESVISLTPGAVDEFVISHLGHGDKPLVVTSTLIGLAVVGALTGILAQRSRLAAEAVFALVGVVALAAVHARLPASTTRYLPALLGTLTSMLLLSILSDRVTAASERREAAGEVSPAQAAVSRRRFLQVAGIVAVSSVAVAAFGRVLAHGREKVEAARARLAKRFAPPPSPKAVSVGVDGVAPWVTPVSSFYRVDTSLAVPLVVPDDWQVHIHGMVDQEITLTYDQLLARGVTGDW